MSDQHEQNAGLCTRCRYAEVQPHPRGGASYWRCGLARVRPDFPKYPRLPVLRCRGFESTA